MAATEAARLPGSALLAAALALPGVQPASADSAPDQRSVSFRYLDYLDRQPGRDRVRIKAPTVHALAPLGSDWSVSGSLVSDAISGASPSYHSSALSRLRDKRQAGDLNLTRYLADGTVSVGAGYSTEADYVSRGLTLQASRSSDDRNTTWHAGLAVNRDAINPVTGAVSGERKRVADLLFGVTRVLSSNDVLRLDASASRARGYLSDPYKLFDERPRERRSTRLLLRWNHHLPSLDGTLRLHWRAFRDDWGVRAHTLGLEWVQPWRWGLSLTPQLRLHTQSAARFYVDAQPGPSVPLPPPDALHSSFDHRLSAFGARTWGLKLAKTLGPEWTVDVKLEHYEQRAAWRIGGRGSPGLEPFQARSWQVGLTRVF